MISQYFFRYWSKKWQERELEVEKEIHTKGHGKECTVEELLGEITKLRNIGEHDMTLKKY